MYARCRILAFSCWYQLRPRNIKEGLEKETRNKDYLWFNILGSCLGYLPRLLHRLHHNKPNRKLPGS